MNLGVYDVLAKPLVQGEVVRVLTSAWIQQLTRQMHAAHSAYKEAAAHYNQIKAKYGGMLDSLDGAFALRRAAANERRASEKYQKAVNEGSGERAEPYDEENVWGRSRAGSAGFLYRPSASNGSARRSVNFRIVGGSATAIRVV